MYIKQVIIEGFKSYRERTNLEPFDPAHNVIVGRNGSGKSNFFHAIEFVLSNEYMNLPYQQRQLYLHEGTGQRIAVARVEIILDNSDGRLSIQADEVRIQREFGSKMNKYFINKKFVTRKDVTNLLESAGFTRSNPYYIVKQGKINKLATAPDGERLKLLQQIAGMQSFEDRAAAIKKILCANRMTIDKIDCILKAVDNRHKALQQEDEELKEYQEWDKKRRYLEYMILNRRCEQAKKTLEELENSHSSINSHLKYDMKSIENQLCVLKRTLQETDKMLSLAQSRRNELHATREDLLIEEKTLTESMTDLIDVIDDDEERKKKLTEELSNLDDIITKTEKQLSEINTQYEAAKCAEEQHSNNLSVQEQRRKELLAKEGRKSQFSTKDDRNVWIRGQLKQLNGEISQKEERAVEISSSLDEEEKNLMELRKKIENHQTKIREAKIIISKYNEQLGEVNKVIEECSVIRRTQKQSENDLQTRLSILKDELTKCENSLRYLIGKNILIGQHSVAKVLETFSSNPETSPDVHLYHGQCIDILSYKDRAELAVDTIAGNRLFHHVVETAEFGEKILEEMNRQGLPGDVTFISLNKLQIRRIDYPKSNNAKPMLSILMCQTIYDSVLQHIFGSTMICNNLNTAAELAAKCRLNCVTLTGDSVLHNGIVSGGCEKFQSSKVRLGKARGKLISEIQTLEIQLNDLRKDIQAKNEEISGYMSNLQKIQTKCRRIKDSYDSFKIEIRLMQEELLSIEKYHSLKKQSLSACKAECNTLKVKKEMLENELNTELMSQLTMIELESINDLTDSIRDLTLFNKEALAKRMKLEAMKKEHENLLKTLYRQRDQLINTIDEENHEKQCQLEILRKRLEDIEKQCKRINDDIKVENDNISAALEQKSVKTAEIESVKAEERRLLKKFEEANLINVNHLKSHEILKHKIDDYNKKMDELGVLPNSKYRKFEKMSQEQLLEEIERVYEHLKPYREVNVEASIQLDKVSAKKESLMAKKEKLDRELIRIQQVSNVLEQKKNQSVQFTLRQVNTYFNEVFQKLVPGGCAKLVMRTAHGEEDKDFENAADNFNRFVGVGIQVSFAGQIEEMQELNQLSGGQKSLVALALIFAIQKYDPAPFYLFDEIDQALDVQHRVAVANMIHELSSESQFITTTFRPELLQHANKFYGVKFRNKVSHIECVTREEAFDFVENDTTN